MPAGRAIACDPQRYLGYFEAHIEQGGTLEATGRRIGIVEAIIGNWNYWVTVTGEQNHAGTTEMHRRKDAAAALVRLAARIHDRFAEIAGTSRTVWTIGRILIDPNAPSIVPGRAEMQVQFRDTDTGILARFEQALHELVAEAERAGPCAVAIAPISKSEPAQMDAGFQRAIESAAERHAPGLHMRMPSGAGHDAQILAAPDALGDDVRAEHQRHQPSLVRGHERRRTSCSARRFSPTPRPRSCKAG